MTGRLGGLGRWRRRDGQSGQINGDRAGQLWAAALEHAHVHPAIPCRKRKTQHCWRWLARHCGRPYQDECRGAFFSSQLKSAKGAVVGLGQRILDGADAAEHAEDGINAVVVHHMGIGDGEAVVVGGGH